MSHLSVAAFCHFYPRSPCGERRGCSGKCLCWGLFLSTLSLRRATAGVNSMLTLIQNFYPRSPCGERRHKTAKLIINIRFLSTLSLRRATHLLVINDTPRKISIHALLAESDIAGRITSKGTKISIHALLAESD